MTDWKATESPVDKSSSIADKDPQEQRDIGNVDPDDETAADLEKVQSSSKKSDIDPSAEPPDGGLNAWLKVLGCFLIYSNIW
jgi:hypothetical protein